MTNLVLQDTQDEDLQEELRLKVYGNSYDNDYIIDEEHDITAAQQSQICSYSQKWIKQQKDNCLPRINFLYLFL